MMLEVEQMNTSYGISHILFDVNLQVAREKSFVLSAAMVSANPPC